MKLNRIERLVVNNPLRALVQAAESAWFARRLTLPGNATVLEIGCGRGAGVRQVLSRFGPARLLATDLDLRMIRAAGRFLSAEERRRTAFAVADAEALPMKPSSVDAVFGFGFLHHVPRWRRALEEIRRVLAPGGVYCLEELYPAFYQNRLTGRLLVHPEKDRFKSRDLSDALTRCGFAAVDRIDCPPMGILGIYRKQVTR